MAFPAVEKKAIEQALGRFDEEFRDQPEWAEIQGPFGGSSQSAIAPSTKAPVVFLFSEKSGEQYGYTDEVDVHGVSSYAGEGQVGDMMLNRGNLAAQQHAATGQALQLVRLGV